MYNIILFDLNWYLLNATCNNYLILLQKYYIFNIPVKQLAKPAYLWVTLRNKT